MIIQVEYTDDSFQRGTVDLDLPPQRDGNVDGFAPVVPKSIESISYLEVESIRLIILEELSSLETRLHDPSSL